MAKPPRFDTSFNFGANRKPKKGSGRKAGAKSVRKASGSGKGGGS
jgi:hypothetical protein